MSGPSGRDLMGPVGWIFADALLALTIVFLATQAGGAVVATGPTGTTETTTSPTTDPTTTTTSRPPGVDRRFMCFRVTADATLTGPPSPQRAAHLAELEQQVRQNLTSPELEGLRAGIVLTFGVAEDPGVGTARAEAFNALVLPRVPAVFRRSDGGPVASRAFWGGATAAQPEGSIEVNIYPMVDVEQSSIAGTASGRQDC